MNSSGKAKVKKADGVVVAVVGAERVGTDQFREALGKRGATTPKSFVLGKSSFKGMGIDFGDLGHSGKYDMVVSNITAAWGLEESNYAWVNKAKNNADMRRQHFADRFDIALRHGRCGEQFEAPRPGLDRGNHFGGIGRFGQGHHWQPTAPVRQSAEDAGYDIAPRIVMRQFTPSRFVAIL